MAQPPKRYYVEYENQERYRNLLARASGNRDAVDMAEYCEEEEFDTLNEARAFRAAYLEAWGIETAPIYERRNIVDDTPAELAMLGITWNSARWDDEIVED